MTAHPAEIALALVLTIAVVTDVSRRKIYNWLTFPAIGIGLALNTFLSGVHGLVGSLEGIAAGTVWLLIWFLRGGTSAGDVKLLQAVGAMMGPAFTWGALLYTALAGGVMGVFYAARRGVLSHTLKNAFLGAHVLATVKSPESLNAMADQSKAGMMPSAPAIAVGALIEWIVIHHWI